MSFGRLSRATRPEARRRAVAALALPVAFSLCLAACGGDDSSEGDDGEPTDSTNTAGLVNLNATWPLTGETLEGDLPDHPVYVVKIDNTSSSAPQVGLGSADMIVEELVEGGLTRLAVFFYSDIPDDVGPVRSMRASDIAITTPVGGNLVASGAANITAMRLDDAKVPYFRESMGGSGFFRDDSRTVPYNLFNDLQALADDPGNDWETPERPYLSFGPETDFVGNLTVKSIEVSFSSAHTTTWAYSANGWTSPDSFAEHGDDFLADSVLVLRVKTKDAGYHDAAGSSVPETILSGRGEGVLVHGDKALNVTWSKKDEASTLKLTDKQGTEVTVPVGHTWIELVPISGGKVTLGK